MAFVFGDLFSQSFCGSLDLFGIDGHTRQFGQQFAAFLEADHGTHRAHHAREGGRERGVFYAQLPIARAEAVTARRAMIVGALQLERTENALHLLATASDQARFLPTPTTSSRASLIAGVGVETLLDRGSRQLQDLLPHRQLQRFQIQVCHRLTTEQRLNLLHDVAGQEIGEEVFFYSVLPASLPAAAVERCRAVR